MASFNAQDQADDPSTQDCRCVPRDFLITSVPFRQVFARPFFKHIFLHLIFQFASQGSGQELPIRNQDTPYQGFWRFDFQFRCFWFRFDIQSVVCVHGVGLSFSWLCLTVFLISFCGHTLFVFMYMSFASAAHDEYLCLSFISFHIHYSLSVTIYPLAFALFYSAENEREAQRGIKQNECKRRERDADACTC